MKLIACLLLVSVSAFAAKKEEPTYQDAVLKSFRTVQAGMHCSTSGDSSGTVNANTVGGSTNGSYSGTSTSSTNCSPHASYQYTVVVAEQTLILTPKASGGAMAGSIAGAMLTGGASNLFHKDSCLSGQLPGTAIKIRSEGTTIYVKCGKKESQYRLLGAE